MANSHLIYDLSSSINGSPQFQYVSNLYDSGSNKLTTIKQRPNPYGLGVFDWGRIARQYLGIDNYAPLSGILVTASLNTDLFNKQTFTAAAFKVKYQEEFSNSLSGSLITGSLVSSSVYNYWINGFLDNNYGAWEWDTSSYFKPEPTPSSATFKYNVGLTYASKTASCQIDDILTISMLNGNLDGNTSTAQDIFGYRLEVYSNNAKVYDDFVPNVAANIGFRQGGPRSSTTQLWSAVASPLDNAKVINKQTENTFLIHSGIGPKNIANTGLYYDFLTQPWDYYEVTFCTQQGPNTPNYNGVWDKIRIEKQNPGCGYDTVRFCWINDFGVWDYWNFTLASSNTLEIGRANYEQSFVDYSTPGIVPYDIKRRGVGSFDTKIKETKTVSSDWLNQEQAEFLESLFYSPSVYIQSGSSIIPIVIENKEVLTKTNIRTQKMYNYVVEFTPASQKRSR